MNLKYMPDRYLSSFGYWLRRYRKEALNLNLQNLAHHCACSVHTIVRYESGKANPPVNSAAHLASVLQLKEEDHHRFILFAIGVVRLTTKDFIPMRGVLPPTEGMTLSDNTVSGTVETEFEFPEEVKISCQQYLLYFVEFLRDIGIDATANLSEDAGQVLFSVTPKDKDEALDNIREALAIYLRLPMSRNTTVVVSPNTSIEVQKLSAQLHYFQGQLYLASATLQQKELTIQQQGTTIHYQQSLIEQQIASGQVLVQALQKEAEDAEPVGGIVKVKAWSIDGIPIELDLPTLMRMLKERFKHKRHE